MASRPRLFVRKRPQPDELLSTYVARLSEAHGLTPWIFLRELGIPMRRYLSYLDTAPSQELLDLVSEEILIPRTELLAMCLPALSRGPTSATRWLMNVHKDEGVAHHPGWLQFCPLCLAEDEEPYFRRRWRLPISTCCVKHGVVLKDRCEHCGMSISPLNPVPWCHRCPREDENEDKPAGYGFIEGKHTPASPLGLAVQIAIDEALDQLPADLDEAAMELRRLTKILADADDTDERIAPADMNPLSRHILAGSAARAFGVSDYKVRELSEAHQE